MSDAEDRAKVTGWVPEEEFKGDPDRWTPAEDWNERADNIMPILKTENEKLRQTLTTTKDELTKANKTSTAEITALRTTMEKMIKVNSTVTKREYDRALETIKKEQFVAVSEGKAEDWQRLENDKDTLVANQPEDVTMEKPAVEEGELGDGDAEFDAWKDDNKWFGDNGDMTGYAAVVEKRVATANPSFSTTEILNKVSEEVLERFPMESAQQIVDNVDSGNLQDQNTHTGKMTYSKLPQEAKDQCNELIRPVSEGGVPGYTKEKFIADYEAA